MHIPFRQMQILLALAEHGSITAAARACHVTQPTASMQLKELSDTVGLPIYELIGKRLYLTAAGEAVVETARKISDEWEFLQQTLDGMKGHTKGKLRVAVVSTAKYFVPRMLGSFCSQYPEIDIAFEVLNRDGVVHRLRRNADDLYIMSLPPDDMELERHAFLDNPLVAIAPALHPLSRRKRLQLDDLAEEPFVLREPGSGTRLTSNAYFEKHKFKPKVRLELGSNEAIIQAVAGGLGLTIVSAHALPAHPEEEGVKVLSVAGLPIHSNWSVIYPRGKRLSPVASVFLQHLMNTEKVNVKGKKVAG